MFRLNYFKRNKRRQFILYLSCLSLTSICFIIIFQSALSAYIYWEPLEDNSCHYVVAEDDALPSADDESFSSPPQSIFFHETSCNGVLDSRQACAVESAARAHPEWQTKVLFCSPVTKLTLNTGSLAALRELNVTFARVQIARYAKGTPLENLVAGGALNNTRWRISHTSDVLRYLTLYKWGGVYLDLDVVVTKSFESLTNNWVARESDAYIASSALSFSIDPIGRSVAEAAIRDMQKEFRGDIWGHNGPMLITRVLKTICSTEDVAAMSAATCNGFEVYGPEFFNPIEYSRGNVYFEPGELNFPNAYMYHIWNRLTHHLKIVKDSPYDKLARQFCPTIYKLYGDNFGS